MPSEDTKILGFTHYQKSDKAPFIDYIGFECLIERLIDTKIIFKIHPQQK